MYIGPEKTGSQKTPIPEWIPKGAEVCRRDHANQTQFARAFGS